MMKFLTTTKTAVVYANCGLESVYSYGKNVLEYDQNEHRITLGKYWDYSVTTLSHIRKYFTNFFFDGQTVNTAKLRKAIKDGTIVINGTEYRVVYDREVA